MKAHMATRPNEEEAEEARFLKKRRRMADRSSDREFMKVLEAIYAGKDSNFDDKPDGVIYRLPWRSNGSVWPGHQALLVVTKRVDQWSPVVTIEDIPVPD